MGVDGNANHGRDFALVLIPYSSGMGVGPRHLQRLHPRRIVLIPYSSGMGVGPTGAWKGALDALS